MKTLHIVSHTHWDREWYKTFQQFRLQLVHLVDNLLAILERDPTYLHFMLDGQTIVLEDYLHMRMANLPLLQKYIRENRILIGPWYILPDEFLVSPEATIRNLLIGKQICALFGQRMMIGYIPDPFGHISQMPQILNGFHMDTACLWRGVPKDFPTVFNWQAPDGSRVLLAHLYDGYGNIAQWPAADPDQSLMDLDKEADKLEALNPTDHFLMMRGTDHLEPRPSLPEHIRYYNQHQSSDRQVLHSTLPAYLAAVSRQIEAESIELPTLVGELRDPQKVHILPGVLSARMWIKQRNHFAETKLERWVEPFSTWAELVKRGQNAFLPIRETEATTRVNDPGPIIHQAWKLLISNHPHDSICGCSIDETHSDMVSRFDQVDQIAELITDQSLNAILSEIDTTNGDHPNCKSAITVFNAAPYPKTDLVTVDVDLPDDVSGVTVYDQDGNSVPADYFSEEAKLKESNTYPVSKLMELLTTAGMQGHNAQTLIRAELEQDPDMPAIRAQFSSSLPADSENLAQALSDCMELIMKSDPDMLVRVKVYEAPKLTLIFTANDVPALGYKTWWLEMDRSEGKQRIEEADIEENEESDSIENEFFRLTVTEEDGSFSLYDKRLDVEYTNLNMFVDRGDRGDEYNFTPPENDEPWLPTLESIEIITSPISETMIQDLTFSIPISLSETRDSRSKETVDCPMQVILTLTKGIPAVDVQVAFDNQALDHRLEVQFPSNLHVATARYDSHFQIIERPIDLPEHDPSWQEHPRPEVPQRAFADVSTPERGLMIANRGLPEVSVVREPDESATIVLTLLRCVGWLSRDDMWNRRGQAGPPLPTPGAQELKTYLFHYSIIPRGSDFLQAAREAQAYQCDLMAYAQPTQTGKLPAAQTMVDLSRPEFMITALKEAESEDGWILRGVNLSSEPIDLTLTVHLPFVSAALVNLDESPLRELETVSGNEVNLTVGPYKIVSLFFRVVNE